MSTYTLKDGRVLTIYRPRAADAEELLEYLKIVGGETNFLLLDHRGIALTVEQEREFLESAYNNPRAAFFTGRVAAAGRDVLIAPGQSSPAGEIALTCQVTAFRQERLAHVGEIAISVRKDFWSLGVGSFAMREMIGFAKSAGVKNIELGVYANNERAKGLYSRFGFVEVGRHKNRFCVNGEYFDEIIMDLYL